MSNQSLGDVHGGRDPKLTMEALLGEMRRMNTKFDAVHKRLERVENAGSITLNFERFLKVWQIEQRRVDQFVLNCLERLLFFLTPFKAHMLLHNLGERGCDCAKVFHETVIESR